MQNDRLDPFAILAALGRPDATRASPVSGGADTALWRIDAPDRSYALRVLRPEQTGQFHRELVALAAAGAGGVPVPAVHATGTWRGHPAMLLDWCAGQTALQAIVAHPDHAHTLGIACGRTQAAIHVLPAPAAFAGAETDWIDWARPDDALRSRLLVLARRAPALLHLDYHPLNIMIDQDQVSAVLDWANARIGDPRADLARTLTILRFAPALPTLPPATSAALRRTLTAGWRTGYRSLAGESPQMAPFYAWAGAAMVRDLAPRLGRPDLPWLTAAYLDQVQAWTGHWRSRASLPAATEHSP